MNVIALSGKMHSGKSYIADRLVREHGYRRMGFAEPLKDDIRHMAFKAENVRDKPGWMRTLMQAYGQARRAEDPDYWVKRLIMRLDAAYVTDRGTLFSYVPTLIVIDDLRFPNEAQALKEWAQGHEGARLIVARVHREGYDRTNLVGAMEASETAMDNYTFDLILTAESGDLNALECHADYLAGEVWDG